MFCLCFGKGTMQLRQVNTPKGLGSEKKGRVGVAVHRTMSVNLFFHVIVNLLFHVSRVRRSIMPAGSGATPWCSRGPCLGCARLEPRWPRVMVMVIPFPSRPVPSSSMQTWAIERDRFACAGFATLPSAWFGAFAAGPQMLGTSSSS